MKKIIQIALCAVLFFVFHSTLYAQVRINEFLIDPLQKIELFNIGNAAVDLTGWFIDDSGGTTFFTVPNTVIPPNSCSIFESDFNLNKSSADTVRLFDNTAPPTSLGANLVDSFSYKSSSGSGISFKRIPDGSGIWATGPSDIGFYNNTANSCIAVPSPTPSPTQTMTPSPSTTPIPTPTIITSPTPTPVILTIIDNVFLSEAMVNPLTGEKEWAELYNDNDFQTELSGWYIDDIIDGGSSPKSISVTIPAKEYAVIEMGTSLFNNEGDTVRLLDSGHLEKDKFEYLYSEKGESWGRISFDAKVYCLQEPTYGAKNASCNITDEESTITAGKKNLSPTTRPRTPTVKPREDKALAGASRTTRKPTTTPHVRKPTEGLEGEILGGQTTKIEKVPRPRLHRTLSLLSLSYGLLTMISVFLKIKAGIIALT